MANLRLFTFLAMALLVIPSVAVAQKSEEFFDGLSKRICEDCKGADIRIKDGIISENGQPLPSRTYENSQNKIKELLKLFSTGEPFRYLGFIKGHPPRDRIGPGPDGYQILTCGTHWLTITVSDYYWDDTRFEAPTSVEQITYKAGTINVGNGQHVSSSTGNYSPATSGNESPATSGQDSPVRQNRISLWVWVDKFLTFTLGGVVACFIILLSKKKKDSLNTKSKDARKPPTR